MRYLFHHIKTIVRTYDGGIPLTYFLKNYFKVNPKLGSRDRKILSDMAYSWYRCSKGFDYSLPFEEKLNAALYLCDTQSNHVLQFLPQEWQQTKAHSIDEKIAALATKNISFDIQKLAPFKATLSGGITRNEWLYSMLRQPRLFIRVRDRELVPMLLQEHNVPYEWVNDSCMSIANGSPVDKILVEDSYAVQDASSQQTGAYFNPADGQHWWDCCSGAGGKSLLLKDINKNVSVTVSDKRESIIHNLLQRFQQYHHEAPQAHILNLTDTAAIFGSIGNQQFDSIISDVPCTGAGTWARTPEQLYFFKPAAIAEIATLQATIATNVSAYINPGGYLFYITCSVFEQENEAVANNIIANTGMSLQEKQLINGIGLLADSMFIAVLKKGD